MRNLGQILNTFSYATSEPEIRVALAEFFEEFGATESVYKSPLDINRFGKREFVVSFQNRNDTFKVASALNLRLFG